MIAADARVQRLSPDCRASHQLGPRTAGDEQREHRRRDEQREHARRDGAPRGTCRYCRWLPPRKLTVTSSSGTPGQTPVLRPESRKSSRPPAHWEERSGAVNLNSALPRRRKHPRSGVGSWRGRSPVQHRSISPRSANVPSRHYREPAEGLSSADFERLRYSHATVNAYVLPGRRRRRRPLRHLRLRSACEGKNRPE